MTTGHWTANLIKKSSGRFRLSGGIECNNIFIHLKQWSYSNNRKTSLSVASPFTVLFTFPFILYEDFMLLLMFLTVLFIFLRKHFFQIIVKVYKFIILSTHTLGFQIFFCVISSPLIGYEEGDLSYIFKKVKEKKGKRRQDYVSFRKLYNNR